MAINTYFKNIADAIREKTGGSALITPGQMPGEIRNIPTGGVIDDHNITFVGFYGTSRRSNTQDIYAQISRLRLFNDNNELTFNMNGYGTLNGPTTVGEPAQNVFNTTNKSVIVLKDITKPFMWFAFSENPIDITRYNKWRWYTANDGDFRDPVSFGLLLGSGDILTDMAFKLYDYGENRTITTNRNALAYEGLING